MLYFLVVSAIAADKKDSITELRMKSSTFFNFFLRRPVSMKKADKERLEAKYTGNQRHLSEAEIDNIIHDPANEPEDADQGLEDDNPLAFENTGTLNRLQR
jgi:hypothetical protein